MYGKILEQLERSSDEAKECGSDGSAHDEWLEARNINKVELAAIESMVPAGTLPLGQFFRVGYEAGYKAGSNTSLPPTGTV